MSEIGSSQIKDGQVKRADLNTSDSGSAVVRKLVAGTGITLDSTGVDAGTGDVTINATGGTAAGSTGQVQYNSSGSLAAESALYYDSSTNQLALGNSTPITDLTITKSVGLDGSNPVAITLHSTNNSGSWTAGARVASLDYYSDDLSGTGNTPGVRNRIAFESAGTTGGAYDLNIYGDGGAGLFSQLKLTKDGFNQFNGNTGAAALAVSPLSTNVSACVLDGMASQTANIFKVRNSSGTGLFDVAADGKVGIGNSTPAKILDVTSTTSGVLLPRMTSTQRDAISSPTAGEMIYNSTTSQYEAYIGGAWTYIGNLITDSASAPSSPANGKLWVDTTNTKHPLLKRYDSTLGAFKTASGIPCWQADIPSYNLPTSMIVIAMTEEYNSDSSIFSWSDANDELTVNSAGTYLFFLNLPAANASTSNNSAIYGIMYNDTGGGYAQLQRGHAGCPTTGSANAGGGTLTILQIKTCISGEKIQFKAQRQGSGGLVSLSDAGAFIAVKLL